MYQADFPSQSTFHPIYGLNLHLRRWPAPGRPKVLLLHGWMDCSATFQFVADALAGAWDVYASDWRGHGLSAHQSGGHYDRNQMLADLAAWADLISPDAPLHLFGHSMGGMLAAHYAALLPQRVKSLILAEAFGIADQSEHDPIDSARRFLHAMAHPAAWHDLGDIDTVAVRFAKRHPQMGMDRARFVAAALTHTLSGSLIYRADIRHNIPRAEPYRLADACTVWQHIRSPLLWVAGGMLPHNHYLNSIADTLPQRHAAFGTPPQVHIPQSGHMLHWEAPVELAEAAAAFWTAQTDSV